MRLDVKVYTDTLFADNTSMKGNKCAQLYTDREGFLNVFMMRSKAGAGDLMGNVVNDISIMNEIRYDNALEQVGTIVESMSKSCKYNIHLSSTEPYSPWQNKSKA